MIRRIELSEIEECLAVIHRSFETVAKEFGITQENCPTHTSFMKAERLYRQFNEGRLMYAYIEEQKIIGYFSLAQRSEHQYELTNLAVLPEYRHKGIGKAMISFAVNEARKRGCYKINLQIIEENTRLKTWYQALGFSHIGTQKYEHLPFTVGLMEICL